MQFQPNQTPATLPHSSMEQQSAGTLPSKSKTNAGTVSSPAQNAAFEMLMNAIGTMLGPVVHQLLASDPNLVHMKGWHGMTALHRACLIGDYNIVLTLVQANSDVNAVTDFNETPLHYASKRGIPTIVHLLVQCGSNIEARDKRGRGVLHHAAENGSVQVLKYFEDAVSINFQDLDYDLQSPLHIACNLGHYDVVKFLIANQRCDLKQADAQGNLPLHVAAAGGFDHMTWLLLSASGASAGRVRNKHGLLPINMAMQNDKKGNKSAAMLLHQYQLSDDNIAVTGPTKLWYFLLLYPFAIFSVIVFITRFMESRQYIVFLIAGVQVFIQVKGLTPRLQHISRWPNPFFVGFFSAGIFHTIICFLAIMFIHVYQNVIFLFLTFTTIPCLLYSFYKFMVQDPGIATTSSHDPQTGKKLTLVDLCRMQKPQYNYCHVCDKVTDQLTKHCKLCNICVHGMDHHCLFLHKCVARNNHATFVWLIIFSFVNMCLYLLSFYIYISTLYGNLDYYSIATTLIHTEMWPTSLLMLNFGSAFWSANLIYYQYLVISKGCTSYYGEEFHREEIFTHRQKLENFVYFLLGRRQPHKNPFSPFVKNSETV